MLRRTAIGLVLALLVALPATAQGYKRGQEAYHRGEFKTALREWSILAEKGYATSQYSVGVLYDRGQGVPQDHAQAAKWYRKAAEQGYAGAQYNLGVMYTEGHGVPQGYAQAAKWYRKAAEQGHARAQGRLGFMYGIGQGVHLDYVKAYMWISLQASNLPSGAGRNSAINYRRAIASHMTQGRLSEALRLAREWRAKHPKKK